MNAADKLAAWALIETMTTTIHIYRHGIFVRACSRGQATGYIEALVNRGYGAVGEYEVRAA